MLADAPGEEQLAPVVLRRLAAHDLHRLARVDVGVRVLDEQATHHAPVVALARRRMAALRVEQHAHRRLRRQGRARVVVEAGGEEHLDEVLGQSAAERAVDRAIAHDDASVCRDRVGRECALVRLLDRLAERDATGILVLHDHAGGHRELLREGPGGRQVGKVVERQGVALQLVDAREDVPSRARLRVEGGALMRVLAVREVEHLVERRRDRAGALLAAGEPRGDRGLVGGRCREGVGGEAATGVERELAVLTQFVEHGAVLIRAADRRHARVVLRRRPQHRGAADVDHLDGVVLAHAPAPGDLRERIEVHAHELERPDAELVERERVLL